MGFRRATRVSRALVWVVIGFAALIGVVFATGSALFPGLERRPESTGEPDEYDSVEPAPDSGMKSPPGEAETTSPPGDAGKTSPPVRNLDPGQPAPPVGSGRERGAPPVAPRIAGDKPSAPAGPRRPPPGVIRSGSADRRWVAFTFDDGPDDVYTPRVLDELRRAGARATFFVTAAQARAHPQVLRRIVAEGHEVGNHGEDHALLTGRDAAWLEAKLRRADALLRSRTGRPVRWFRPAYGAFDAEVLRVADALRYRTVLWSVDTRDWQGLPAADVIANSLAGLHNGAIILNHSATGPGRDLSGTPEALPELIAELRSRGYRLVTLSEMLGG